ncbi:MAG: OmpA family protein, partial [Cryomorphaceae bacterium]|nr:OmpA family protein [Cryomorphaceae bacterium]
GIQSGRTNDVLSYMYAGVTFNLGKKGNRTSLVYSAPMSDMYSKVRDIEDKIDKLTKDSDGDGVSDYFDKDPDTPEGVAVDGAGRPLDVDMDGIPDYMDADPFTNKGVKVDKDGRELDSDGDGVPDSQDLEPNTPKGALVDVRGRQIDLSKADAVDAFLPQIYFAFNSATVTAANRERLATIARVLHNNENLSMTLVGHTDKVGSEEYNKKLGERRAQAVKDYLVKNFNIDGSRLEIKSKGKGQPLGNYNNINRRVEMYIK